MKRILVTGGAQGIGRAIVDQLLGDPDTIVVVIDKQKTGYIKACEQQYISRFEFHMQDIADGESLTTVLKQVMQSPLNAIVNNAGEVYLEKWDDLQIATWNRTLAVNVTAPLQIVHGLRDTLVNGASVVNIASTDAYTAAFDTMAYAASKAALISLTKSLAANLGSSGIRVNAIAPGWVETEMTKDTLPEESVYMTPLKRNAAVADVANLVRFLLSDQSSFISGETITVDGGLSVVDYSIKKESEHFSG